MEGALAPTTVRIDEIHLRRHLIPFFGGCDIRSVRIANIQELHELSVITQSAGEGVTLFDGKRVAVVQL